MSRRNERLYHIYHGMKQRCYNENNPKYNLYGGKGIKVCDEWNSDYELFKEWAYKNGYLEELRGISIDRIDSSQDYCPENCQWITIGENSAKASIGRKKFNGHRDGIVYAENLEDNSIVVVENITKFAKSINVNPSTICHKINGRTKSPYINGWKFYRK